MTDSLKTLPLAHRHAEFGAKFAPFAGFEMPMQYTSIMDEHRAVRSGAGLFDVSHMGEIRLVGKKAVEVANQLISHDLRNTKNGQARYAVLCTPEGGIVDDLIAYKISDEEIFFCVNASNQDKDFAFMVEHCGDGATLTNESEAWGQFALQGQDAEEILAPICMIDLAELDYYHFAIGEVAGVQCIISRTGYTGEAGFELYVPTDQVVHVFDHIVSAGRPMGMAMCGLGCRDTLRLEAKFPLYGNDLSEQTNPLEAGLAWVVKLDKPEDFVGRKAIEAVKAEGVKRRLRGYILQDKGVLRPHYAIHADGAQVGELTSGTFAPSLGIGIGMGYVDIAHAERETVEIEIRGRQHAATMTRKPFYQRDY